MMQERTRIKVCGITELGDRDLVAAAGADYFGVVLEIDYSPRSLSRREAKELFLKSPIPGVALMCDRSADDIVAIASTLQPYAVQLQGLEPPELVASLKAKLSCAIWKGLHLPASEPARDQATRGASVEEEVLGKLNELAERYAAAGVEAFILDTMTIEGALVRRGGTGRTSNWEIASRLIAGLPKPAFLAGGIRPDNVADAIRQVRPFGVDLSSGVERAPGKKDPELVRELIAAVRLASEVRRH